MTVSQYIPLDTTYEVQLFIFSFHLQYSSEIMARKTLKITMKTTNVQISHEINTKTLQFVHQQRPTVKKKKKKTAEWTKKIGLVDSNNIITTIPTK